MSSTVTWVLWLLAGLVSAGAYGVRAVAVRHPDWVEAVYAQRLYPVLAHGIAGPARLVSFSLAECLLGGLVLGSLMLILWAGWESRRRRPRLGILLARGIPLVVLTLGLGAHAFLLLFGLHYLRPAVRNTFGLTPPPPDVVALERLARTCLEQANAELAAAAPHWDAERGSRLPMSPPELIALLTESFNRCPELSALSSVRFSPPKAPWSSHLMARAGIAGIFVPLTGEPHYDADQPAVSLPFTIAHEMAHQRGFALESEANFVAAVVCIRAQHPYLRYSGWAGAARYVLRDLARAPERYAAVVALAGDALRADWQAQARYWSRYAHGRLAALSARINHAYLQANGVTSGLANYHEVTGWLLAWQAAEKRDTG